MAVPSRSVDTLRQKRRDRLALDDVPPDDVPTLISTHALIVSLPSPSRRHCPARRSSCPAASAEGHAGYHIMGIPKMFRFLADRYPLILHRLDDDHVFDHFYLDMNGIIHQCTHPSDSKIAVEDFDKMFARITHYTERLFRIVAPTKLMFLAVDGVAPRAKMNQQRSRRFRSAKDAERTMAETVARGDGIPSGKPFDSNCITPGTQFMYDLTTHFRYWIREKMSSDPAFQQGCSIVFSGPEVPGEGEHKIMDYIRAWKASDDYDPSVHHCMYGLDADLMMLGLVANMPHFTLIRERMRFSKHGRVVPKMRGNDSDADEFELLEVAMLRDMLFLEFKRDPNEENPFQRPRPPNSAEAVVQKQNASTPKPFTYSARRIVDDFVFMCMLIGNDFLPNLPHLDIADGAITDMFRVYKRMVPEWGGYLTDRHRLHPGRLESFLSEMSQTEEQYFQGRAQTDNVPDYRGPKYRRAYYKRKFKLDIDAEDAEERIHELRTIYMEGLHWVLQYYHIGVSSWNWFYPNFYAVLASDMKNLRSSKIAFQRGRPFRPLTQLMAVLPPESADFLPAPMRDLMINPNSPVSDFYPIEFRTDMNGKRNDWEAVVVVPFIDEVRLLTEVNRIDKGRDLTEMERKRDELGLERWFHARDFPRSGVRVRPVRPSKFSLPKRGRTPSPSSSPSSTSRYQRSRSTSPSMSSRRQPRSPPPSRGRSSDQTSRGGPRTGTGSGTTRRSEVSDRTGESNDGRHAGDRDGISGTTRPSRGVPKGPVAPPKGT